MVVSEVTVYSTVCQPSSAASFTLYRHYDMKTR